MFNQISKNIWYQTFQLLSVYDVEINFEFDAHSIFSKVIEFKFNYVENVLFFWNDQNEILWKFHVDHTITSSNENAKDLYKKKKTFYS